MLPPRDAALLKVTKSLGSCCPAPCPGSVTVIVEDPLVALNFFVALLAGDYIELVWCSTEAYTTAGTGAYIEHYAAPSSPTRPAIPSVIVTATWVSS